MAYMQLRIRAEDQYTTSSPVSGCQCEFCNRSFGLHSVSSVLMNFMHSTFVRYHKLHDRAYNVHFSRWISSATPSPH